MRALQLGLRSVPRVDPRQPRSLGDYAAIYAEWLLLARGRLQQQVRVGGRGGARPPCSWRPHLPGKATPPPARASPTSIRCDLPHPTHGHPSPPLTHPVQAIELPEAYGGEAGLNAEIMRCALCYHLPQVRCAAARQLGRGVPAGQDAVPWRRWDNAVTPGGRAGALCCRRAP